MKADDFPGQYQMMGPSGIASAEEVKVLLLDESSFGLAPLVVQEIYQLLSGVADGGIYASLALAL